jgi:AcrR family transcriptional regulator
MPTRPYHQSRRAESAEGTRTSVLEALYRTMRASPGRVASIDQIAAEAGVSRSSIYLIFGSRAGLLDEFGRYLFDRAGYANLVEAVANPDALAHLRAAITVWSEVFASERDIFAVMFAPVGADPGALEVARSRIEAARLRGLTFLAEELRRQHYLRAGMDLDEVVHTLWMLTSFGSFDALHAGRGLSAAEVAAVLLTAAERTLLATPT